MLKTYGNQLTENNWQNAQVTVCTETRRRSTIGGGTHLAAKEAASAATAGAAGGRASELRRAASVTAAVTGFRPARAVSRLNSTIRRDLRRSPSSGHSSSPQSGVSTSNSNLRGAPLLLPASECLGRALSAARHQDNRAELAGSVESGAGRLRSQGQRRGQRRRRRTSLRRKSLGRRRSAACAVFVDAESFH